MAKNTQNLHAHQLFNRLKSLKVETTSRSLEAAAVLSEMEEGEVWRELDYPSWKSFVGDPDLDLSTGYVSTAINIHRKFILEFKINPEEIAEIGWSKVAMILPVVTKENVEELLGAAQGNSKSDLAKTIKQLKNGVEDGKHKHEWKYYRECTDCGEREPFDPSGSLV